MLGYLAKSVIIVTYRNNSNTLWVQVMEVWVQYCLCCSDVFSVRKQCFQCCFLNMSSFSLQRASNLENSTYDLYTIPKDADSQNPDGGCSLSPPLCFQLSSPISSLLFKFFISHPQTVATSLMSVGRCCWQLHQRQLWCEIFMFCLHFITPARYIYFIIWLLETLHFLFQHSMLS